MGIPYCYLPETKVFMCIRCAEEVQTTVYAKNRPVSRKQVAVLQPMAIMYGECSVDLKNTKAHGQSVVCRKCGQSALLNYSCL